MQYCCVMQVDVVDVACTGILVADAKATESTCKQAEEGWLTDGKEGGITKRDECMVKVSDGMVEGMLAKIEDKACEVR